MLVSPAPFKSGFPVSAETIHTRVRAEFDSYSSLKAQTFTCRNKKTNTCSDCRSTSNQRTAPSVWTSPPWQLFASPSDRTRRGPELLNGRFTTNNPSEATETDRRGEGSSEHTALLRLSLVSDMNPSRSLGGVLTHSAVPHESNPAEQVEPAPLMWIHTDLRVSCYITDAWILMTALLGALFSSLLGLTYTQICTVCTVPALRCAHANNPMFHTPVSSRSVRR